MEGYGMFMQQGASTCTFAKTLMIILKNVSNCKWMVKETREDRFRAFKLINIHSDIDHIPREEGKNCCYTSVGTRK